MAHTKHREPFRVTQYQYYPADSGTTHNAKYFEHLDGAQAFYMQKVIEQVMETRLLEYVAIERFNEHTMRYHPMFESHQRHTIVSYGLDHNA